MPLRRLLLALAIAAAAGTAAAVATPALAAPSASANATVTASFIPDAKAETGLVYIKHSSAMSTKVITGVHLTDGRITTSLMPGRYVIQIINVDTNVEPRSTYATRTFTVRSGQHLSLGTLKATHQLLTLRGHGTKGGVVTDDFTGWESTGRQVKVSKDGTYAFPGLVPGTYTFTAEKKGFSNKSYTVLVREPHADITVGK
jgi:hypothetical protein